MGGHHGENNKDQHQKMSPSQENSHFRDRKTTAVTAIQIKTITEVNLSNLLKKN